MNSAAEPQGTAGDRPDGQAPPVPEGSAGGRSGGGSGYERPLPPEVDAAIRATAAGQAAPAALALAAIAHRAITELNKLARAEASRRRGQPDWGTWAGLSNSARDAVLKVSTCRKSATELAGRVTPPSDA